MIEHYITHIFPNRFKAQVVTVSRLAAIRYKKALEEALTLKGKIEEMKKKGSNEDIKALEKIKVEVVISGPPDDDPEYQPYTDERKHDRIIQSFKLPFDRTGEDGISGDVCILAYRACSSRALMLPLSR